MAALLVGLQSRCQIDMRCEHRVWSQAGSLRTGSQPFIGRRERLAKGLPFGEKLRGMELGQLELYYLLCINIFFIIII